MELVRGPHKLCLAVMVTGLFALWFVPASASALPDDPPITPLSPANGAGVPVDESGIDLTFLCLDYHSEEPSEDEEEEEKKEEEDDEEGEGEGGEKEEPSKANPKPKKEDLADSSSYMVRFSTSSATGAEGLLTTSGFGEDGEDFADPEANKVTCGADFEIPDTNGPAALYHGTVYWQVAREVVRDNDSDSETESDPDKTEWEVGPVWSFNVQPKIEDPWLETQEHIYAGYLTAVEFSTFSELTGATIELQRFSDGAWTQVVREPVQPSDQNTFFVKMPASRTALRAVVSTPTFSLPLEPKNVTVRKAGKRRATSAKDNGRYRAAATVDPASNEGKPTPPLTLKVVKDGTKLVGLRTSIEVSCPGPTELSPDAKVMVKTALRAARIAPDGTVVGRMLAKGPEPEYVTFVGQFFDRRLSGTLTTAFGRCSGSREIEAVKAGKKRGHRSAQHA